MSGRFDHERTKELVFEASRLPREQRAIYVERVAGGDATLIAELRSLLEWLDAGRDPSQAPSAESELYAGALLKGRYRIGAKLGQGRSGAVYRAHDELLDLAVAIKRSKAKDPKALEQLRREAAFARSIHHPNVRRIYETFVSEDECHLVMELAEGRDLGARLRDEGPMAARKVAALALEIASGLAAVHEAGAIHGDMKPENIVIGATGSALISDFGVARNITDREAKTPRGGTLRYLSPERRAGAPSSPSSDVYALALLLRDLLVGRSGESEDLEEQSIGVDALMPEVDPRLADAISRGLLLEPSRPAHAGEFLELLRGRAPATAQYASAARRPSRLTDCPDGATPVPCCARSLGCAVPTSRRSALPAR